MVAEWVIWSILGLFCLFSAYGGYSAVKEKRAGTIHSYFPAFMCFGIMALTAYLLIAYVPPF